MECWNCENILRYADATMGVPSEDGIIVFIECDECHMTHQLDYNIKPHIHDPDDGWTL